MMTEEHAKGTAVLEDIRVLELSTVLAAPVAATFLGDFGAEIIKVEEPGRGDFTRTAAREPGGRTPMWAQEGRNKRSITIDLHRPDGQDLVRRLAARSDVVVTNFRPTTLERWSLTPVELLGVNGQLVVLAVTGYGQTGPYRNRGSFDRVASAFSGHTYVSGEPGRPPMRAGFSVVDFMSAYLGAFAVMVALRHRDQGGGGQIIDLALYEAAFRATESAYVDYAVTGRFRERTGNRNPLMVPATESETADGRRVAYHAGTPSLFARLAQAIGRPELTEDPRFADPRNRVLHQKDLYAMIDEWIATMTASDVIEQLSASDIPCSQVMSMSDIAEDPHYRERKAFEWHEDPEFGPLPLNAPVPKLSKTPGRIRGLGESLGASTEAVCRDLLGLSADEIAELRRTGVL